MSRLMAIGVVMALAGCAMPQAPDLVVPLAGPWAFHPGDNPAWADPALDDSSWPRLKVPTSWGLQGYDREFFGWYRVHVAAEWPREVALGVTIGDVHDAYELYAGGLHLGGIGRMPQAALDPERQFTYAIPDAARSADGSVLIALRVWRAPDAPSNEAGPTEGPFEVGPLSRVAQREARRESLQLALVVALAGAALYYIGLWALRPAAREYGWFALLLVEAATYSLLTTPWRWVVFSDVQTMRAVENVMLYALPATSVQFVWTFFRQPISHIVRGLQAGLLATAAVVALAPVIGADVQPLPALYLLALAAAMAAAHLVMGRMREGDPESRVVGLAILAALAAAVHDGFVERGWLIGLRLTPYGFGLLVLGMAASLASRFHRTLGALDALNRDLEARVASRTEDLKEAYRLMEERATHDGLTGLLNRHALEKRALSGLSLAHRGGAGFAVALLDVDHFKAINDTRGHAAGDQVLKELARRLQGAVRASDDVGRWGGEEFLLLLPATGPAEAVAAARRLHAIVGTAPVALDDGEEQWVSSSIGVAAVQQPDVSHDVFDELIKRADAALYEAKAGGRNCVVAAS